MCSLFDGESSVSKKTDKKTDESSKSSGRSSGGKLGFLKGTPAFANRVGRRSFYRTIKVNKDDSNYALRTNNTPSESTKMSLVSDLIAANDDPGDTNDPIDPVLNQIFDSNGIFRDNDQRYNPLARYDESIADSRHYNEENISKIDDRRISGEITPEEAQKEKDRLFNPCEPWADHNEKFGLSSSLNYVWIMGSAITWNMAETSLSKHVFGVKYEEGSVSTREVATCEDPRFSRGELVVANDAEFPVRKEFTMIPDPNSNNEEYTEGFTGETYVDLAALEEEVDIDFMDKVIECFEGPEMGFTLETDEWDGFKKVYETDPPGFKIPNLRLDSGSTVVTVPREITMTVCAFDCGECKDVTRTVMVAVPACRVGNIVFAQEGGPEGTDTCPPGMNCPDQNPPPEEGFDLISFLRNSLQGTTGFGTDAGGEGFRLGTAAQHLGISLGIFPLNTRRSSGGGRVISSPPPNPEPPQITEREDGTPLVRYDPRWVEQNPDWSTPFDTRLGTWIISFDENGEPEFTAPGDGPPQPPIITVTDEGVPRIENFDSRWAMQNLDWTEEVETSLGTFNISLDANGQPVVGFEPAEAPEVADTIDTALSHPCWIFCTPQLQNQPTCYTGTLPEPYQFIDEPRTRLENSMNLRRSAIVKDQEDARLPFTDREAGYLYMSIKDDATDKIYNVRVQHNLHENFILGSEESTSETDGPSSGIIPVAHQFTWPIPFCPNIGAAFEYEYAICNVPRSWHGQFGLSSDGTIQESTDDTTIIPHCLVEDTSFPDNEGLKIKVGSWVVSNVRVGPERIPDSDSWEDMGDSELGDNWQHGYQLLSKTTFSILSASPFSSREELCNIDQGQRGLRYIDYKQSPANDPNILFNYYTWGIDYSETRPNNNSSLYRGGPDANLFIYLDTNPDSRSNPTWRNFQGRQYADLSEEELADAIINPTLEDHTCLVDETGRLKSSVYNANYSPLVINVYNKKGVYLLGLDAEIEFLGRRFPQKISKRMVEYDNTFIMTVRDPKNLNMGVYRTAISQSYVKTGWIDGNKGDALLVYDLNNNGQIDSGMEVFGESTVMEKDMNFQHEWGTNKKEGFAANGFVALLQYDDNGDYKINEEDDIWEKLLLWQDGKDGEPNAIVDSGEFLTLEEVGITAIDINTVVVLNERDKYGNRTLLRSTFSYTEDGKKKTGMIYDIYFVYEEFTKTERNAQRVLTEEEKNNLVDLTKGGLSQ